MVDFEIMNYKEEHKERVKEISYEWLRKSGLLEPTDEEYIEHPEKMILGKGGAIFVAKVEDEVVGSVAIVPCGDNSAEICKLGVAEHMRGNKIGPKLVDQCLEWGKATKLKKIYLYSNSKLVEALRLYEKIGFTYIEDTNDKYEISDIKMVLELE